MYLVLSWQPDAPGQSTESKALIDSALAQIPFVNVTSVSNSCYVANVKRGRGTGDVFDLETALRPVSSGKFTFTLVFSRRGNLILHSGELDDDDLKTVVDY